VPHALQHQAADCSQSQHRSCLEVAYLRGTALGDVLPLA